MFSSARSQGDLSGLNEPDNIQHTHRRDGKQRDHIEMVCPRRQCAFGNGVPISAYL